jgi:hypothetical protein
MLSGKQTNFIVTCSNIFGIVPLWKSIKNIISSFDNKSDNKKPKKLKKGTVIIETIIIGTSVIASVLMHISETKHGLPGLFFVSYCNYFLWFDRIVSLSCCFYFGKKFYDKEREKAITETGNSSLKIIGKRILKNKLLYMLIAAGSCCFISEMIATTNVVYATFHSIWHALGFMLIGLMI